MDKRRQIQKQKRRHKKHIKLLSGKRKNKRILQNAKPKKRRSKTPTRNPNSPRGTRVTYKILLHPKAAKTLSRIQEKDRIIEKLKQLKKDPTKTGNHLKHSEYYRLRIGDYRAIYEINQTKKQIIILFIGHRKNVYDDFSKLL